MALIKCENVSIGYEGQTIVRDLNFEIGQGDYLCIVSENGSGKSTLVKSLLGLKAVDSGKIEFGDGLKQKEIGYLPQQNDFQKDFPASVYEVVLSGRLNSRGFRPFYTATDKAEAAEKMEMLGITDLRGQCFRDLSGGQKQRLSIARAIAKHPDIYIFDDSFSALDYKTDVTLRAALKEKTQDSTVIIVAQRISTILHAEQIIVLDDGKIAGIGTHKELLKSCDAYYQIASSQLSEAELARDLNNENDGKEEA